MRGNWVRLTFVNFGWCPASKFNAVISEWRVLGDRPRVNDLDDVSQLYIATVVDHGRERSIPNAAQPYYARTQGDSARVPGQSFAGSGSIAVGSVQAAANGHACGPTLSRSHVE